MHVMKTSKRALALRINAETAVCIYSANVKVVSLLVLHLSVIE